MTENKLKKAVNFSLIYMITCISIFIISCSKQDSEEMILEDPPTEEELQEEEKPKEPVETCNITDKDGYLIIEAESFDLKGNWRVKEDVKASGGKYIEYHGWNSYAAPNSDHEISVSFYVPDTKHYLVKWYMRQPDEAEGDKSNDAWIYFEGNYGKAYVNDASITLEHFEKFVSRGKGEFAYGGNLDLHNPKSSSWLTVQFPEAGVYTVKISGRSEDFQLDKIVLSTHGTNYDETEEVSKTLTETIGCREE
jgi:hypothetical protein